MIKFFKWLFKLPDESMDYKTHKDLENEIRDLQLLIKGLELEVVHWKNMPLTLEDIINKL